jgi:hypothetical protein
LKNLGHPWRRETVFPFFFFLSKIVHLLIEIDPRGETQRNPGDLKAGIPFKGLPPTPLTAPGNSKAN